MKIYLIKLKWWHWENFNVVVVEEEESSMSEYNNNWNRLHYGLNLNTLPTNVNFCAVDGEIVPNNNKSTLR